MSTRSTVSAITYGLLAALSVATFVMPRTLTVRTLSAGPAGPPETRLTGVMRDFRSSHEDFGVVPGGGFGHYAGDVAQTLGADGRPVFAPDGYRVDAQSTDGSGHPIAPHLFVAGGGGEGGGGEGGGAGGQGVRVDGTLTLGNRCVIDSFRSSLGEYGIGGNQSEEAVVSTNSTASGAIAVEDNDAVIGGDVLVGPGGDPATVIVNDGTITGTTGALEDAYPMPVVTAPSEVVVGPNTGDVWYKDDPFTISSNMHVDDLRISNDAVVTVDGNVTILVEGYFRTETRGVIIVSPGSSLDLYVKGDVTVETRSAWSDPRHTRLHVIGSPQMKLQTDAAFYGTIFAPEATLLVQTGGHLFGSFIGRNLECKTQGSVHVDLDGGTWETRSESNLAVDGKLSGDGPGTVFDGYDSGDGSYGGANAGLPIAISTNATTSNIIDLADVTVTGDVLCGPGGDPATAIKINSCTIDGIVGALDAPVPMPMFSAPTDMGPSVGDVNYIGGTSTLSTDVHCDQFNIDGGAVLEIEGSVTVLCEGQFKVSDSELRLRPGARLTLYCVGDFKLENGSKANASTALPDRFILYHLQPGSDNIKVDGGSELHALIQGRGSELTVAGSEFFGTFVGGSVKAQDGAGIHIDLHGADLPGCVTLDDAAGARGATGSGGIASAASFGQWFRDVPGANVSAVHKITLTRDGAGVWNYLDDAFHPLDGRLWGDEGDSHNNHFTYHIRADFTYEECWSQFVEFEGGDGVWLFINGSLVLDLGGVGAVDGQYVQLDRLGLLNEETYTLDLFYAQRQSSDSVFRLRTTLDLEPDEAVRTISAMFD